MHKPSKLYRFIRVRIIGLVDLTEAILRIIFGEKAPNLTLRLMAWEIERNLRRKTGRIKMMWEYQVLYFQFVNQTVIEEFNEEGKRGWELVQVITKPGGSCAIFKRERVIV